MKKLTIKRRGINARRPFRALNSATELLGKEVELVDGDELVESTVAEVDASADGDTTVILENGDDVTLDQSEVQELLNEGEVTESEAEPESTPEETELFDVTREVLDADGNPIEVTTTVEAPTEEDAVRTITMLDSRRKRNSRNYRVANSRKGGERENNSRETNSDGTKELKEFKIARCTSCDGKRIRKVASVTAPTVEDAIAAVQKADSNNSIEAEGYEELIEEMPTESQVTINSDVDIVIDEPETPATPTEPEVPATPAEPETPATPAEPEEPTTPTEPTEPETPAEPEIDRESNSFKGVADFVRRKYGASI